MNGVAVRDGDTWCTYTRENGMVWDDDCAANGVLAEPNGGLWIGTLNGLARLRESPNPPPFTPTTRGHH